jgi:hypothetical protein
MADNRVPVTVRLTPQGLAEIDRMADDEERDRSSMIRLLLKRAVAVQPDPTSTHQPSCPKAARCTCPMPVRTVTRKEQV